MTYICQIEIIFNKIAKFSWILIKVIVLNIINMNIVKIIFEV